MFGRRHSTSSKLQPARISKNVGSIAKRGIGRASEPWRLIPLSCAPFDGKMFASEVGRSFNQCCVQRFWIDR
jgi:hypothetical protein